MGQCYLCDMDGGYFKQPQASSRDGRAGVPGGQPARQVTIVGAAAFEDKWAVVETRQRAWPLEACKSQHIQAHLEPVNG